MDYEDHDIDMPRMYIPKEIPGFIETQMLIPVSIILIVFSFIYAELLRYNVLLLLQRNN